MCWIFDWKIPDNNFEISLYLTGSSFHFYQWQSVSYFCCFKLEITKLVCLTQMLLLFKIIFRQFYYCLYIYIKKICLSCFITVTEHNASGPNTFVTCVELIFINQRCPNFLLWRVKSWLIEGCVLFHGMFLQRWAKSKVITSHLWPAGPGWASLV